MAIQIANPEVIRKVEARAKTSGLNKSAAIEKAVDSMLREAKQPKPHKGTIERLLAQIDQIPDRKDAFNPVEYDELGLPK